MSGVIRILVIVAVIWAALEFHNEGLSGAFGGLFARANTNPLEHTASAPQRVKAATDRALQLTEERRRRLLGE